jgi:hypothetical protein
MIVIKAADRIYKLNWTKKGYRDEAGHLWKVDSSGTKINCPLHGTFLDFQAVEVSQVKGCSAGCRDSSRP